MPSSHTPHDAGAHVGWVALSRLLLGGGGGGQRPNKVCGPKVSLKFYCLRQCTSKRG